MRPHSDADLYGRLWREVLQAEAPDFARTPHDVCSWNLADTGSGDERIWLTYYASEDERLTWAREADGALPPHQSTPFKRDHRLPVPERSA